MVAPRDLNMGMKCIKYMLFVSNFMFVLVGLLLISIGCTIKSIYSDFSEFMENHYYSPSALAIVVGIFIFLVALFGCIGAYKESTCLINTYTYCLMAILILQLSIFLAAASMRKNIYYSLKTNMDSAMANYDKDYNNFAWESMQHNLRCCGILKYDEWTDYAADDFANVTINDLTYFIPTSCCAFDDCSEINLFKRGCLNVLNYIVSQSAFLLSIGALCISFIQILGIIFARMLAKSIRLIKTQMLVEKEQQRRTFYEQMQQNSINPTGKTTILFTAADDSKA